MGPRLRCRPRRASSAPPLGAVLRDMTWLTTIETLTAASTAATIGAVAGDVARLAAVETLTAAATTTATTAASVWPRHRVGQIGDVQILAYVFNFTVTLT